VTLLTLLRGNLRHIFLRVLVFVNFDLYIIIIITTVYYYFKELVKRSWTLSWNQRYINKLLLLLFLLLLLLLLFFFLK